MSYNLFQSQYLFTPPMKRDHKEDAARRPQVPAPEKLRLMIVGDVKKEKKNKLRTNSHFRGDDNFF